MSSVTVPQHMVALEQANRRRLYRADVKRGIGSLPTSAGLREVAGKLDDPMLDSMELGELLGAVRRVGPSKIVSLCRRAELYPGKRIGSLTGRQRDVLRGVLS